MNSTTQQNPYAPPRAQVSDPAETDAAAEPAGRGVRFGAAIIDGLIYLIAYVPVLIGIGMQQSATPDLSVLTGFWGILSGLIFLAIIAINIVFVYRNSQTIGKKLLGIKVVRSDGSHAGLGRIFWLRNVVNAIPSMIPILGYVYVLVDHLLIFGDKRQCVHDKIADTVVVTA
jgi:uncharacterized RDD family membrane protein YckC